MKVPSNPVGNIQYQTAEPMINDITLEEVKNTINSLKNWKAPGSDYIHSSLPNTMAKKCTHLSSKYTNVLGKRTNS